ncbi:MAG: hypothetical protein ACF8MJ_13235 [Phycisphaerales bacterium JB050]
MPPTEPPSDPQAIEETEKPERERQLEGEVTRLKEERDLLAAHLVEAYRRLFLRLPEGERAAFLAELMARGYVGTENAENGGVAMTSLPSSVRELAYDLAAAEVVSARPLGPAIVEAAASGLSDPVAPVRRKAAALLAKLDASAVMTKVIEALEKEPNAAVVRELLTVVARHPRPEAQPLVLAKALDTEQPREVLIAALETLLALRDKGPALDEEQTAGVHRVVTGLTPEEITPNIVRLLARLGDMATVRKLVDAERADICRAAARELVGDASSLELLIARAQRSDAVYEQAIEAICRHTPTATGYRRASELPAPSIEKRQEQLARLSSVMAPTELLTAASLPMDLSERERLLVPVATDEELAKYAQPEYFTEDRRLLLESLVRTRLQLKNAQGALKVIRGLPAEIRTSALLNDELACLIWLNRLDEATQQARAIGNPAGTDTWLATLERIEALDHAPAALARLVTEFDGVLNDNQRERLVKLQERVASLHPAPEPDPVDGDGENPPTAETIADADQADADQPGDAPITDEPNSPNAGS